MNNTKDTARKIDLEELKELFKSKRDFCQQEIQKKEAVIKNLDTHILRMEQAKRKEKSPTGVPVKALSILCCPNCGASFSMQDVEMDQRFLYKGALSCKCGYYAKISSGILMPGFLCTITCRHFQQTAFTLSLINIRKPF